MNNSEINKANILIICEVKGSGCSRFFISIYDSHGKAVDSAITDEKGHAHCKINYFDEYRIRVQANENLGPAVAYRWAKLKPNEKYCLNFVFEKVQIQPCFKKVTCRLTDKNITNSPIKQGVITLWHNIP